MSTGTATGTATNADGVLGSRTFRALSLAGVLVLVGSYVSVLTDVTGVVGGTRPLLAVVVCMLAAAMVVAHSIEERTATIAAFGVAAIGFAYYLTAAGVGVGVVLSATDRVISDTVALATGLSLLRMVEAGTWTLGFAPGPAFLAWYFALRRRYVLAVVPAGTALLFLVLTGDATLEMTLVGTVAGIAAVGFGELEARHGTIAQADVLAVLFAATVLLSMTVTVVPAGSGGPTFLVEPDHDGTLEASLTSAEDRSSIAGEVRLSPEVRFTVRSEEPSYWRVGVYDRFTGDEWIRTGSSNPYEGPLERPPGETETVKQTVIVQDRLEVMPGAPEPVAVEGGAAENTRVTSHGQIRPDDPLIEGDVYNVESAVVNDSAANLRGSGTDYPEEVENRYLQTPEGTSDAFAERTSEIVGDAEDPYDKADRIETYLRSTKGYSLNVSRPDGNVAEEFLLEMDEGYCVYFATTMVQMLREEGVPARYAVGYTTGQQVDDNEWVVRGLNAHSWVEVYFPGEGWVAFEPTPSEPRDDDRIDRIQEAREEGEHGVDVDASADAPLTETPEETTPEPIDAVEPNETETGASPSGSDPPPEAGGPALGTNQSPNRTDDVLDASDPAISNGSAGAEANGIETAPAEDEGEPFVRFENLLLGLALLVGLAAGAHRTGVTTRVSREARLHWRGFAETPEEDVERAYRRLELLLERKYRPRKAGETPRQYVEALSTRSTVRRTRRPPIDPRVEEVTRIYERATYGGGVDRETADRAVAAVDAMVRDRTPVLARLRRRSPG